MEGVNCMIKVGINGFGRIGRFVFRAAQERKDIEIVGINDLCPVDYLAYMLKYDTMHGKFNGTVEADVENSQLIVNGKKIRVTACKNPEERDYDAIRYLRLGEFADMVGYSRDNAKRLAKELNSVRFEWHGREQAAFIYMTNAPDRPEEWIVAVNPRVYYAGQNFELLRIPDCGRR